MSRARWLYLAGGGALIAAFLVLGLAVRERPIALDRAIAERLRGTADGVLGRIAGILTDILGPVLPVLLGVVLLGWLLLCVRSGRRDRAGLLLRAGIVLLLCRLTSPVFKAVFERARPGPHPGFAYPSGHVVSVLSTGFVGIVLCLWLAPRVLRWLVPVVVVATGLAAANRLVLGVHWFTDTVGSVLIVLGVGYVGCAALGLLPSRAGTRGTGHGHDRGSGTDSGVNSGG